MLFTCIYDMIGLAVLCASYGINVMCGTIMFCDENISTQLATQLCEKEKGWKEFEVQHREDEIKVQDGARASSMCLLSIISILIADDLRLQMKSLFLRLQYILSRI